MDMLVAPVGQTSLAGHKAVLGTHGRRPSHTAPHQSLQLPVPMMAIPGGCTQHRWLPAFLLASPRAGIPPEDLPGMGSTSS